MSNTNTYPIIQNASVADTEQPAGYVLVPVGRKDNKKGKSGISCQMPAVSDAVLQLLLADAGSKAWMIQQIDTLRGRIATGLYRADKDVTSDALGIDAMRVAMQREESAGRFSMDAIAEWFKARLLIPVCESLAAKGVMGKMQQDTATAYLELFKALAGRKPQFGEKQFAAMERAMALLPEVEDDGFAEKVAARILELQTKPQIDLLDAL